MLEGPSKRVRREEQVLVGEERVVVKERTQKLEVLGKLRWRIQSRSWKWWESCGGGTNAEVGSGGWL